MAALMYLYPHLYERVLEFLHGDDLKKRYEVIGNRIGEDKKVFELGCGTAKVYPFLRKGCIYEGWDLNERFLAFCQKRGLRVFNHDIFDFGNYPESDVILICDVLHHVVPRHKMLLEEALKRTKKVIVSEPHSLYIPPKWFSPIVTLCHYLMGDYDGINPPHQLLEWKYDKEELTRFFHSLGCTEIIEVGFDLIAVFECKEVPSEIHHDKTLKH